ncbi:Aste57867_12215 [Aphanomyces stellatus]|uniref:Aste57867_12215 protein n=1 Tax=Aphanomyces stellatus TaxID=120398 RepID=A0A485KWZ8_9STRA|nr:hypothetical protein As57867_012170 [Aphanomyces stellatus]VFT89069.1 Aste57867_12215 [Aphanomyces stellatus]
MMMFSPPAAAAPVMRHLRRRREDDFEFGHASHAQAYHAQQLQQASTFGNPTKRFKTEQPMRYMQPQSFQHSYTAPEDTTPSVWYDAADVSSPDSDEMDVSCDVDMDEFDDDAELSVHAESRIVQYKHQGQQLSTEFSSFGIVDGAQTFTSHPLSSSCTSRIEEIFDDEPVPSNAIVVYRPLPPASSWKTEPESDSDSEHPIEYDDGLMEID